MQFIEPEDASNFWDPRFGYGGPTPSQKREGEELSSQCVLAWLFILYFTLLDRNEMRRRLRKLRKRSKESIWVLVFIHIHQKSKVTGAARLPAECGAAWLDTIWRQTKLVVFIYCTLLNLTEGESEREREPKEKW